MREISEMLLLIALAWAIEMSSSRVVWEARKKKKKQTFVVLLLGAFVSEESRFGRVQENSGNM